VGVHRTLQGVTEDHAGFRWNTIVAKLMELTNLLMRYRGTEAATTASWEEATRLLLLMLAPVAPHIAEELWSRRLEAADEEWSSIHTEAWPAFDESVVAAELIELPVQINGKLRDKVSVAPGLPEDEIEALVMARPKVIANLEGKQVIKVIHVGGRLVNIVVR
jgi:leucyl-tRNA synthetase